MGESTIAAANPNAAEEKPVNQSIMSQADQPEGSKDASVLDAAGAEEKAQQDAENKRIMEAKDEDLTPEEKETKADLIKAKTEADAKAAAEAKAKEIPEKYDIKPPDGIVLDEAALSKITPVFKDLKLDNSQAQGLINFFAQVMNEKKATDEAVLKNWNESNKKETMDALGANAKAELAHVAKIKNLFSPETMEAINASGIGNLKSFILDCAKIGKLFSEESLVGDKKSEAGAKDPASILYPSMATKQQ